MGARGMGRSRRYPQAVAAADCMGGVVVIVACGRGSTAADRRSPQEAAVVVGGAHSRARALQYGHKLS